MTDMLVTLALSVWVGQMRSSDQFSSSPSRQRIARPREQTEALHRLGAAWRCPSAHSCILTPTLRIDSPPDGAKLTLFAAMIARFASG